MKRFKGWRHEWHHWKRLELRLFQLFSDNLAVVLDILILNDTYNVGKYIIYLYELFYPVSQQVQINFIFNDNERTLCLSFNIKRSKTTVKLSENSWNKRSSNRFQWCHSWRQPLNRFIISLYTKYRFIKLVQINHCTCIVFLTYQCFRTDDDDYDVKMTCHCETKLHFDEMMMMRSAGFIAKHAVQKGKSNDCG
jgi:hypothetical protein